MKLKKSLGVLIAGIACVCVGVALFIVGATADFSGPDGSTNLYVMEAEYINLDGVSGAGVSSDQSGVEMIYGDGTEAQKNMGWSNGYYVGYTYATNLTLTFTFNADTDSTATINLRLGSELGELLLDSSTFAVKLNGEIIDYGNLSIANSSMESMVFEDKLVTTTAQLVAGENTLELVVLYNNFMNGARTGGPCVDCVKIETTANLTWTDKTDNPGRRGEIG